MSSISFSNATSMCGNHYVFTFLFSRNSHAVTAQLQELKACDKSNEDSYGHGMT